MDALTDYLLTYQVLFETTGNYVLWVTDVKGFLTKLINAKQLDITPDDVYIYSIVIDKKYTYYCKDCMDQMPIDLFGKIDQILPQMDKLVSLTCLSYMLPGGFENDDLLKEYTKKQYISLKSFPKSLKYYVTNTIYDELYINNSNVETLFLYDADSTLFLNKDSIRVFENIKTLSLNFNEYNMRLYAEDIINLKISVNEKLHPLILDLVKGNIDDYIELYLSSFPKLETLIINIDLSNKDKQVLFNKNISVE